jgi:hypothetical protein
VFQIPIIRPRIDGSVSFCTSVFARAMNQIETHPVTANPAIANPSPIARAVTRTHAPVPRASPATLFPVGRCLLEAACWLGASRSAKPYGKQRTFQ